MTNSATSWPVGWSVFLVRTRKRILNRYITNRGPAPNSALVLLFSGTLMPKGLQRQNHLISPRGLRADDAAAYLGVGKTKFLELVDKGTIPRAFTIDSIKIWDRFDLDAVIERG
jgi:hypothetical protein